MGGTKSHNGPIMDLGGINRPDEPNKINDVYFFLFYYFLFALFLSRMCKVHIPFEAKILCEN